MRKIYSFFIIVVFISCNVQKELYQRKGTEGFAYVLPLQVEEEIWNRIKEKGFESKSLYFQLRRENEIYHLLITPTKDITKEYIGFFKIINSGRLLLINNKLYPIVFDSDYDFGSLIDEVESLKKRKARYETKEYEIKRGPYTINEFSFGIRFTKSGELLK
jgi:hypothetical protein